MQHFLVVVPDESKLEPVLRRVDGDGPWASRTIKAVYGLALDAGEVDGIVKGANHTVVTGRCKHKQ